MRVAVATLIMLFGMIVFNIGLDIGMRTRPVFDSSKYQEVGCNDVEAFEYGVKCIIHMNEEDDNVRVFRGEGSIDDFGRVSNSTEVVREVPRNGK